MYISPELNRLIDTNCLVCLNTINDVNRLIELPCCKTPSSTKCICNICINALPFPKLCPACRASIKVVYTCEPDYMPDDATDAEPLCSNILYALLVFWALCVLDITLSSISIYNASVNQSNTSMSNDTSRRITGVNFCGLVLVILSNILILVDNLSSKNRKYIVEIMIIASSVYILRCMLTIIAHDPFDNYWFIQTTVCSTIVTGIHLSILYIFMTYGNTINNFFNALVCRTSVVDDDNVIVEHIV